MAWSGGYDSRLNSHQRVGLFAGFDQDKIRTSEITSITDTASRVFVGVYGQHIMDNLTLDGLLLLGHASHKSTRTVFDGISVTTPGSSLSATEGETVTNSTIIGTETATGRYNSVYISPSLNLNRSPHVLSNGFEFRPSAQVSYTYGSYSGYTETGTTNANLTFGKRHVSIIDSRLQLALAQPFASGQGEIEWRGGVTYMYYGNSNFGARLGSGEPQSHSVPGDSVLFGGYTGVSLHHAISDRVTSGWRCGIASKLGWDGGIGVSGAESTVLSPLTNQ